MPKRPKNSSSITFSANSMCGTAVENCKPDEFPWFSSTPSIWVGVVQIENEILNVTGDRANPKVVMM
jgi:hypothetical protein